jgi:hypothetical protein
MDEINYRKLNERSWFSIKENQITKRTEGFLLSKISIYHLQQEKFHACSFNVFIITR